MRYVSTLTKVLSFNQIDVTKILYENCLLPMFSMQLFKSDRNHVKMLYGKKILYGKLKPFLPRFSVPNNLLLTLLTDITSKKQNGKYLLSCWKALLTIDRRSVVTTLPVCLFSLVKFFVMPLTGSNVVTQRHYDNVLV